MQAKAEQEFSKPHPLSQRLTEIALRCAALPDCDHCNVDEILGYEEFGLSS